MRDQLASAHNRNDGARKLAARYVAVEHGSNARQPGRTESDIFGRGARQDAAGRNASSQNRLHRVHVRGPNSTPRVPDKDALSTMGHGMRAVFAVQPCSYANSSTRSG